MTAATPLGFSLWVGSALAVWIAAIVLAPLIGAEQVDTGRALAVLTGDAIGGIDFDIVFLQRLPRALLGAFAGGTLGLSGAAFQAILRNPLATPYTLGVASAGSLGAVAVVSLGLCVSLGPFSSIELGALLGAGLDVALVSALARRNRGGGTNSLLLAGITVSLVAAALIMLIRYLSSPFRLAEMDRWLMGGLDVTGYNPLAGTLPILIPGLAAILIHIRSIDQLSLGTRMAEARGVDVSAVQRDVFLGGSLATAAVVSAAGPIGFVGLIVPHAVRRIAPRDHRVILPVSFFIAGAFLVLADSVARVAVAPAELPVGVLTAAVGGPLFLWILSRSKGSSRGEKI
ncbi:MAG: iron ABC transporter permease [Proteobacteria bacterium]|nr:iron ABC transporter permease [Pseudomonadota bacterium]